jgi:hypothetical protein
VAWKRRVKAKLISLLDASAGNEIISVSTTMCLSFEFYSRLEKKNLSVAARQRTLTFYVRSLASPVATPLPAKRRINLVELRAAFSRVTLVSGGKEILCLFAHLFAPAFVNFLARLPCKELFA